MSVFIVSARQYDSFWRKLSKEGIWGSDLKSYLCKKSLKKRVEAVCGKSVDMRSIRSVYVDESGKNKQLPTNKLIDFDKDYISYWGEENNKIYGNIVVVLSDKGFEKLGIQSRNIDDIHY